MDRTGYLKLVDFGSAKVLLSSSLTNTICGTPEYLAPEMLAARGHNRAVDFWAIGVFLYELLNRSTPFEQNDTVRIFLSFFHSFFFFFIFFLSFTIFIFDIQLYFYYN